MNRNGTIISLLNNKSAIDEPDLLPDEQQPGTPDQTPIRENAFDYSNEEKIKNITKHFKEILNILGLDLSDDSLKETPARVAKMYIKEIFSGLDPKNKPVITLFENRYQYNQMLVEKNITVYSTCEHHFVPDRKSTRLNSSHLKLSRMPSSA